MKARIKAKIVTGEIYEKKDNQGKGIKDLALLIDETQGVELSGKIIKPTLAKDLYRGLFDFSEIKRFDEVEVELESGVFEGRETYKLFDLQKIEKKK